jgi:hypothetical protein
MTTVRGEMLWGSEVTDNKATYHVSFVQKIKHAKAVNRCETRISDAYFVPLSYFLFLHSEYLPQRCNASKGPLAAE